MPFKSKTSMKMKLKLRSRAKAKAKAKPLGHSTERVLRNRGLFCKILQFFRKFKRSTGKAEFVPEIVSAQHAPLVAEPVEIDLPFTALDDDAYHEYINELLVRKSPGSSDAQESIEVLHFSGLFVNATPGTSVATLETPLIAEESKASVVVEDLGRLAVSLGQTSMDPEETNAPFEVSPSEEVIEVAPAEIIEKLEVSSLNEEPEKDEVEIIERLEVSLVQIPMEPEEALESSEVSPLKVEPEVPVEIIEQLEVSSLDEEPAKGEVEIIEQLEVSLVQTPIEPEEALESSEVSPLEQESKVPAEITGQLSASLDQTPNDSEETLEPTDISPLEQESEKISVEAFEPIETPLECEHEFILLAPVETDESPEDSSIQRPRLSLLAPIETFDCLFDCLKETPRLSLLAPIEVVGRLALCSGQDYIGSEVSLDSPGAAEVAELSTDIIVQNWLSCLEEAKEEAHLANEATEEGLYPTTLDRRIVFSTSIESAIGAVGDGYSSQQILEQSADVHGLNEEILSGFQGGFQGFGALENVSEASKESCSARIGSADEEAILLPSGDIIPKDEETKPTDTKKKNRKRRGKGRRGKGKNKKGGKVNGDSSEAHVSLETQVNKPDVATPLEKPNKVEVETKVSEIEAEVSEVDVKATKERVPEAIPEIEAKVPKVITEVQVPEVITEAVPEGVPEAHAIHIVDVHEIAEIQIPSEVKKQNAPEEKATRAPTSKPDTTNSPFQAFPDQLRKMFEEQAAENASMKTLELATSRKRMRKRKNASVKASNFSSQDTPNPRGSRPMKQHQLKESQAVLDHKKQVALLPDYIPVEHPEDKKF